MGCEFSRNKDEVSVEKPLIIQANSSNSTSAFQEVLENTQPVILSKSIRVETVLPYILSTETHRDLVKATHKDTRKSCWVLIHPLQTATISREMKKTILAHRKLDHPNILKVLDVVHYGTKLALVYEDWKGGDAEELQEYGSEANGMNETWAVSIIWQLICAVKHCHEHEIVLTSLSLGNILFLTSPTKEHAWVKLLVPVSPHTSTAFTAPEVRKAVYSGPVNDVYSCGMILQNLLLGNCWNAKDKGQMSTNLLRIMHARWENVKQDIQKLTLSMICRNHLKRISLSNCLVHPGLTLVAPKPTLTPALRTTLRNLTQCKATTALKKALLQLMLNMVLPCERLWETQQSFRDLDLDGDGLVSEEELRTQIYRLFPEQQAQFAFSSLANNLPFTPDRQLSFSDFLLFAVSRQVLFASPHVPLTFQLLDRDQSQKVSALELQEYFYLDQFDATNVRIWRELIANISKEKESVFNFNQFTGFMESFGQ